MESNIEVREKSEEEVTVSRDGHKLTEAEKKRVASFGIKEKELLAKGYERHDLTISLLKANVVGILLTLPFVAAFTVAYYFHNGGFGIRKLLDGNPVLYFIYLGILIVSFIPLAAIHELIHGLSWSVGSANGMKDMEYGFQKETITPYCYCRSPLSKPVYIFGSLMPMTILGIITGIVSVFLGNIVLLAIAALQTIGGAGDILVSVMLILYKTKGKDVILMDHPNECGLVVFEKAKDE
ncbi:MAG: DUF3267 domain-containing protein [Clostridiales bacterium]|nr:DUF3267 domain-containing protein [Clostridiales bacterium]